MWLLATHETLINPCKLAFFRCVTSVFLIKLSGASIKDLIIFFIYHGGFNSYFLRAFDTSLGGKPLLPH